MECAYKIWWYSSGATSIPFLANVIVSDAVACFMELCSWLYRTVAFLLVCVLFRLICYLQILWLQDFAQVFQIDSDVESMLREHLRIRSHLRIISHRYSAFIMLALIFITANQFTSLLMTTRSKSYVNVFITGELAFCSLSLLAGLLILLRSATRITHKARAVTCLAAKWHACATIDSFDAGDGETPMARVAGNQIFPVSSDGSSGADDVGDKEDKLDDSKMVPAYTYSTISRRQFNLYRKYNIRHRLALEFRNESETAKQGT
ncbi:hypothetical protein LguiB_012698 [Lonicera macranthoides]